MPLAHVVVAIAAKLKWIDGKNDIGIEMTSDTCKELFGLLDNSPESVAKRKMEMELMAKGSR